MNYRLKANITLTAVLLFFLIAVLLEHSYPQNFLLRLLHFVSEAALVGGIADWFAVTAIFKKPLGWGFHTALIPRNREKVIEAVASMVQKELLRMSVIRKKIEGISFLDALLNYIEKQGGPAYLTDKFTGYLRRYAEKQTADELAGKLAKFIRLKAADREFTPQVRAAGEWAVKQGYLDQGLDRLVEALWEKASEGETRQAIFRYLEEIKAEKVSNGGSIIRTLLGLVEMSDGLNLEDAADAMQMELILTLHKLRDRRHPLRVALKKSLLNAAAESSLKPDFAHYVEQFKNDVLDDPLLGKMLENISRVLLNMAASPAKLVYPYVEKCWLSIRRNTELRAAANTWITDTLCKAIQNEHNLIGNMVRETLTAYTDQDLNQFIEEKAGNDLQWIRINGSMIGGMVGLILFLVQELIYAPLISPVLIPALVRLWY